MPVALTTSGQSNLTKGRIATAHVQWQCGLYNRPPFPPSKLPLNHRGSGTSSDAWFLGPARVHKPNGMLIGIAMFAGLMIMTDRPRYSICNNRPHLRTQYCDVAS